ncbi:MULTISPECIES: cell division protein FtsQ/DivIB [unclassified Sphingobacterium]|uniref:cell division protein FtsQ/DivIB n=1 Tax=unclassified Sphingobacterium TaxID=2609468 RepID=UPI0025F22C6F|nr:MULTISPECIES: cell division protein FtsQ [unclassified Sphingobacterium]
MLNKLRNIRWSAVLYAVLGIVALAGVGMLMSLVGKKDNAQVCTDLHVIIEGKETFIDQQDISNLINKTYGSVAGKQLSSIPLHKIELTLEKLPYVSSAEVHMDMDGVMQVKVSQREVIMRVINKAGKDFYVDPTGLKIPVTLKYVPRVLVATGNISEGYKQALDTIESGTLKNLLEVVKYVNNDELWGNQVVQLYVNDDKDIELIPRVGSQDLVIGNADSLESKFDRLKLFYNQILPRVGTEAYNKINVKYAHQIVCERKGSWTIDSLAIVKK